MVLSTLLLQGLARNLEQPETKEWLTLTKDTLMSDRERGAETDEENKKLTALLTRSYKSDDIHSANRF